MATERPTKTPSKEFNRFKDLAKKLVSVPKDEIKKREAEHQKKKAKKS